jgi:hypothetical protein
MNVPAIHFFVKGESKIKFSPPSLSTPAAAPLG